MGYDRVSDSVTNDNHPFQDKQALQPEVELITFYGEGELNLTDRMTAYTEVLLNRRETYQDDYQQYWSYIYSGDYDFSSLGTGVPGGGNSISAAAGWFGNNNQDSVSTFKRDATKAWQSGKVAAKEKTADAKRNANKAWQSGLQLPSPPCPR